MTDRDHPSTADALIAMAEHSQAVRSEAVETAIRRLETRGDLDERERAAVQTLADRLVGRLLAPPVAGTLAGEDEHVETALSLFAEESDPATSTGGGEDGIAVHSGD